MFDAIIVSQEGSEPAARTLSTLVEGVVEGILGRVTLVSSGPGTELLKLAEAAGCGAVTGVEPDGLGMRLAECIDTPHVLAFAAGALMPPGWPGLLRTEIARRGMPGSGVAVPFAPDTAGARLRLILMHAVRGRFSLDYGGLVPRDTLLARSFDGRTVKHIRPVQMARLSVMRIS